jgi:predicted ABC-type ATPase
VNGAAGPLVVIVAGPNGAGKSTTAPHLLQGALAVSEFVNADAIAQGLSAFRPESVAVTAGRIMLARIEQLAQARADFAFETTLAARDYARRLTALRGAGYRAHLAYLSLPNPDLAVARVAERVRRGGHEVPAPTIRRRFGAGLRNFFGLYGQVVDSWQMYDNSSVEGPRLLAMGHAGQQAVILDASAWENLLRWQG